MFKLGSLFDGIGGFPLCAIRCGIEPVWASEIEKEPIEITKKHFPKMKHLGDINNIKGDEIEPVDIITFGSPCQDLSVAGLRAGLKGERSGLFRRAVDIVRSMRRKTNGKYPRFIVWENVPGAFSSNKGLDFRTVLEEIGETEIPMPANGKWAESGMVELPDREIAWRCLDAQYWGVPQRRKRIFLVCDFRGRSANKVLFERKGLSGNTPQSKGEGQGITRDTKDSIGRTSEDSKLENNIGCDLYNGVTTGAVAATLTAGCASAGHSGPNVLESYGVTTKGNGDAFVSKERHCTLSTGGGCPGQGYPTVLLSSTQPHATISTDDKSTTLPAAMGEGGGHVPITLQIRSGKEGGDKGALIAKDLSATLQTHNSQTVFEPADKGICIENHGQDARWKIAKDNVSPTLGRSMGAGGNNTPFILQPETYCIAGNTIDREPKNGGNGKGYQEDISYTLTSMDRHAVLAVDMGGGKQSVSVQKDKSPTLTTTHYGAPAICFEPGAATRVGGHVDIEKSPTLRAEMGDNQPAVCVKNQSVPCSDKPLEKNGGADTYSTGKQ